MEFAKGPSSQIANYDQPVLIVVLSCCSKLQVREFNFSGLAGKSLHLDHQCRTRRNSEVESHGIIPSVHEFIWLKTADYSTLPNEELFSQSAGE
jgi:hypothetical protein